MLSKISPTRLGDSRLENIENILVDLAIDFASKAFKALDDGPG